MNNEKVMAKILNWARNEFYMRPNDLEEGLLIIIPKVIRIDFNLLEYLEGSLLNSNSIRIDNYILKSFIWNKINVLSQT